LARVIADAALSAPTLELLYQAGLFTRTRGRQAEVSSELRRVTRAWLTAIEARGGADLLRRLHEVANAVGWRPSREVATSVMQAMSERAREVADKGH